MPAACDPMEQISLLRLHQLLPAHQMADPMDKEDIEALRIDPDDDVLSGETETCVHIEC